MDTLEAINIVLEAVGEAPIDDILDATFEEAIRAQSYINRATKNLQAKGWWFNRVTVTLTPDGSGYITPPAGYIKLESVQEYRNGSIQIVGGKLFDRFNNTNIFTSKITATFIIAINFEDMPYYAKDYVAKYAAVQMQEALIGSGEKGGALRNEANVSLAILQQEELALQAYNITDNMSPWYFEAQNHFN